MNFLRLGFGTIESCESLVVDEETIDVEETKHQLSNEHKSKSRDEKHLSIITLDEVAWHDTPDDCWIVIFDYVYDCTKFLRIHPGGQEIFEEYAGRDATFAFNGVGHTKKEFHLLEKYLIGELPPNERLYRKAGGVQIVTLS